MITAFTPIIKCLLQNPYHCKCASVVNFVNMARQAHYIVIQEVIAHFILNREIVKSLILHLAQATYSCVSLRQHTTSISIEFQSNMHWWLRTISNGTWYCCRYIFLFHKLKMQIGHFIPNLAEIVKCVSTLWLSQMRSQILIQIFPWW